MKGTAAPTWIVIGLLVNDSLARELWCMDVDLDHCKTRLYG
jgi:hypothetical protein